MSVLQDRVEELFRRCPVLCGFAVDGELFVSELACYPALDGEQTETLRAEIALELSALLDEEPEAAELLPGRTFARTVH